MKLKITQTKSLIGRKQDQRRTVKALGLKRINDSVVKEDRPEIRGMANKVIHLVRVEEVKEVKEVKEKKQKVVKKETKGGSKPA
jgi:large subunit ribosomal protein L30